MELIRLGNVGTAGRSRRSPRPHGFDAPAAVRADAIGYVCSVCGYVYDPAEHDGVAFEDLPDDWKCPRCKQNKEKFNKA
jgi:rubredoxin